MSELNFSLNGKSTSAEVDPDMPLLYVLRGELGMTGTRFGCGTGMCGACTIIMDGKAVQACDTPASVVDGRNVETIESLAAGDEAHPIVAALLELQAGQCGYCLPGIVLAAKALLDTTPNPDRTAIAATLDGNLCRCGAHHRILNAIELAASRMARANQ